MARTGTGNGGGVRRRAVSAADLRIAARRGVHWSASLLLSATLLFCLVFVLWAHWAELDQITVGQGRVIPSGQVQTVQHLEGGIVSAMLVKEGDRVEQGQPLLQIDVTQAAAGFQGDRAEYLGFLASRARLEAEVSGRSPVFPPDVQKERPALVASELALFNGRRSEFESSIDVLQRQAEQRRSELRELESRASSLARSLSLAREEVAMMEPNVEAGISSRVELLRAQRETQALSGQLAEAQAGIPRVRSSISEAERRIQERRETFRAQALGELNQVQVTLAAKGETMRALEDRVQRTEIRAPVAGLVKRLTVNTVGGVVKPGEPLAEIVPADASLLIEASVKPADIAFLRLGQPAKVKITAYDFAIYGSLDGELDSISPDAFQTEKGDSFYKIKVRTASSFPRAGAEGLPILPGMVAEVNVITGKTTVLDYLLKPLIRLQDSALRQG